MSTETSLLLAVSMLLGNAFFVGAEFGLVSARRSNIELKALNGSRAAKLTLVAMEQVSLMLAGAQLGVTLCSLIFGAVSEPLVGDALAAPFHSLGIPDVWLEVSSFTVALALMVYVHVVIGEMVPKNLALAEPTKAALFLVPPLFLLVKFIRPVVVALNVTANYSLKLIGIKPSQEIASSFSRDEVAGFVRESHKKGLLSKEEEHLLSGALGFDEQTVKSVILPMDKIVSCSSKPAADEIERLATQTGFSRFPVAARNGSMRGYVHIKDTLRVTAEHYSAPLQARYIRPLAKLRATTSLPAALAIMQQSGAHVAQVSNGRGRLIGVVMLEDVLEKLVGVIRDDTQRQQARD